jgi:hypothetical protein
VNIPNLISNDDFDPKYGDRCVTAIEFALIVGPWVMVVILEVAALFFLCWS